jgi:fructose-bisphosphate aldolase class II
MAIVPLKPILDATKKYGYAQGAFNVNSLSQAKAAIEIHQIFHSPAILQGADLANAFMGGRMDFMNGTLEDKKIGAKRIADAVRFYGKDIDIPVALHLDHGKDFESVKAAIDNGYTSVMIDGSHLPYEENIALTREVVKYAHERGITVEGELGVLAGVEDDVFSKTSTYTNPLQVCDFFMKTKVDCLAISYGTQHGANKGSNVKLRKEIVIASMENMLHQNIDGVLVSHGSSTVPRYLVEEINSMGGALKNAYGIPIDQLKEVIPMGIGKINIDTDVRLAVTRNIRHFFTKNPSKRNSPSIGPIWELMEKNKSQFDPRAYLPPIKDTLLEGIIPDEDTRIINGLIEAGVKEAVGTLVVQFDSVGKAPLVEIKTLEEMADFYKAKGI